MIIYCYVLLSLRFLSLGTVIQKGNPEKLGMWLGDTLIITPLVGRILGWW